MHTDANANNNTTINLSMCIDILTYPETHFVNYSQYLYQYQTNGYYYT